MSDGLCWAALVASGASLEQTEVAHDMGLAADSEPESVAACVALGEDLDRVKAADVAGLESGAAARAYIRHRGDAVSHKKALSYARRTKA